MTENRETPSGAQALYAYLRARTEKSLVTGRRALMAHPPEGVAKEELSALLDAVGTDAVPAPLTPVQAVRGRKDLYYYESALMTGQYAALDVLLQEKDILRTIASVTRSDSALYPRPTQFSKLMDIPFRFTMDELLGAAARMQLDKDYEDIGVVQASNGAQGFFSSRSLSRAYARSLLEMVEVEEKENP